LLGQHTVDLGVHDVDADIGVGKMGEVSHKGGNQRGGCVIVRWIDWVSFEEMGVLGRSC